MASEHNSRPTYALLGATGSTGSSLLRQLLSREPSSISIKVYVRSEEKLLKAFPDLHDRKNVSIHTGSMNGASLQPCLENASVIFNAIATNSPTPGNRIAQDTAEAVLSALKALSHSKNRVQRPNVVYLSSASLNEYAMKTTPRPFLWFTHNGLYNVYEDMRLAMSYYKSEGVAKGLMELTCVCPGAIVDGPKGSRGEGVKLDAKERTPMCTYPEVARAMIEMGENAKWTGREALMISAQPPDYAGLLVLLLTNVFPGLVATFVPALFPFMKSLGFYK